MDLIEKIIVKYLQSKEINNIYIEDDEEGGLNVSFNKILFTINKNDKWVKIKKRIDAFLKNQKESGTCEICEKEMGTAYNARISCNECYNVSCFDCYIEIYKTNEGICICPFCRYAVGEKLPPYLVELGVEEMEYKKKKRIEFFKKEQKKMKKRQKDHK